MTDSQSFWAAAAAENVDDVVSQASLQLWVGETSESIMTRFVQPWDPSEGFSLQKQSGNMFASMHN